MIEPEEDPQDDAFADLLARYDESLARGVASELEGTEEATLRNRLQEASECLKLLESAWPRHPVVSRPLASSFLSDLPTTLGRFQLVRELGRGGHGVVFLGYDPKLRRSVALKVPRPETLVTDEMRKRFQREAEIAARLDHPNLVAIHEVGQIGPICFLVTSYCPGPTLAAWLRDRPVPAPAESASLLVQLVEGVAYMHSHGVLHRDIKPCNIMLQQQRGSSHKDAAGVEGQLPAEQPASLLSHGAEASTWIPRLTDFGLARETEATHRTQTGTMLGTLAYMAPEQADGRIGEVGPASDIYAVGTVLYECLTGRQPFQGATPADVMRQILQDEPLPPRRLRREIPRDLETICLKCLNKEPRRRYANAQQLAADLRFFLDGNPIKARPVGTIERSATWMRRHPTLTSFVSVTAVVMLLLSAWTASYAVKLGEVNDVLKTALGQAEEGEQRLREEHYAVHMKLVDSMQGNDPTGVLCELLNGLRPTPAAPTDLRGFEWYYHWGLAKRDLRLRHRMNIDVAAISPDGKLCASGCSDHRVRFWDTATGNLLGECAGHSAPVGQLRFSRDGRQLASATMGSNAPCELIVWDAVKRQELARLPAQNDWHISRLTANPTLTKIAFTSRKTDSSQAKQRNQFHVMMWEWAESRVNILAQSSRPVHALQFSPDGALLAVASDSPPEIQFWEMRSKPAIQSVLPLKKHSQSLSFSPDGHFLASGSVDGQIESWNLRTSQALPAHQMENTYLRQIKFAPDSARLAVLGDLDNDTQCKTRLRFLDWPGGQILGADFRSVASLVSFSFDRSGDTVALASGDQQVHLWRPFPTGIEINLPPTGKKEAWSVAFSPDSKILAVGYDDETGQDRETLKLWDPRTGKELANLQGHTAMVTQVLFTPTGRELLSSSYDGLVRTWDIGERACRDVFGDGADKIKSLALSADGRKIAVCFRFKTSIKLWNARKPRMSTTLSAHTGMVSDLAFSPDGKTLASGDPDGELRIWDIVTGTEIHTLKGVDGINALAYSPDGKRLAIGTRAGIVEFHDSSWSQDPIKMIGHTGEVRTLAFSPDGRTLASAGDDRSVRLWHVPTGRELGVFKDSYAHGLAFSPDGTMLAAALHDGQVRIWHVRREER